MLKNYKIWVIAIGDLEIELTSLHMMHGQLSQHQFDKESFGNFKLENIAINQLVDLPVRLVCGHILFWFNIRKNKNNFIIELNSILHLFNSNHLKKM